MCLIWNGTAAASFSCCHHESILVPPRVSSITGLPLFKSIASSSGWTTLCQFCVLFLLLKMYRNSSSARNKSFTSCNNHYLGHTKVNYQTAEDFYIFLCFCIQICGGGRRCKGNKKRRNKHMFWTALCCVDHHKICPICSCTPNSAVHGRK